MPKNFCFDIWMWQLIFYEILIANDTQPTYRPNNKILFLK